MQSTHHQTSKHTARNNSMWSYTWCCRRGILTKDARSSSIFYKTSITSSLSVHWEDSNMVSLRRDPWSSPAQPPAQSRVLCEVRSRNSWLHLAWSCKTPRMEPPDPPQITCSSLTVITTRKLFLDTPQTWDDLWRDLPVFTELNLKCNAICYNKIPNHGVESVEASPLSWPNFANDSSYQDFAYPLPNHPYCRAWRTDLHNMLKRPSATKQCMSKLSYCYFFKVSVAFKKPQV